MPDITLFSVDAQVCKDAEIVKSAISYRLQCPEFCLITTTLVGSRAKRGLFAKALFESEVDIAADLHEVIEAVNREMKGEQTAECNHTMSRTLKFRPRPPPLPKQKPLRASI